MSGRRFGLGNAMGVAVVAAINLAIFREAPSLLGVPAIFALVVFLDIALARLLIWRQPLGAFELGFIAAGFVALMASISTGFRPNIAEPIALLAYRSLGVTIVGNRPALLYADSFVLGALILSFAFVGGLAACSIRRRWDRLGPRMAASVEDEHSPPNPAAQPRGPSST